MRKFIFLILILILSCSAQAFADPGIKDINHFKNIPVLDGGRIKPLDTYARSVLTQLSGKDHYEQKSASHWLASVFFNPSSTSNDKIFLINNPDVLTALGIMPEVHRRYTPNQLRTSYKKLSELQQAAIRISEKERSIVDNEIIRVFDNVHLYVDLSSSFSFVFPQANFTIKSKSTKMKLGLKEDRDQFSFIEIALHAKEMAEMTKSNDTEIIQTGINLLHWSKNYTDLPFTVIPAHEKGKWVSPWDALIFSFNTKDDRQLVLLWANMAIRYTQGNQVEFDRAVQEYIEILQGRLSKEESKSVRKFPLELVYHVSSPFTWAIMLYIATFLFFVISFTSSRKIWYQLGVLSVFAAFAIHGIGLLMRIIIMGRPPVSSLYETFIFVGFISVFLGLMIEHYNRQWLGMITASISGAALLFIANKYSAEGDTLKVLIAVLNSNFWLATHVTTITMGYGATCVGGLLGHIWLIQAIFKKDRQILDQTYKTTLGILGVALTLTFLGTNLGGIWADQSWGRFWGWDPKENGALMIVLWIAMLFHAKVAQIIGPLGLAVGSVIGMMVVMWAWFGVNLLSVGLHSYGFTSGISASLLMYVVFELVFIIGSIILIRIIHKKESI